MRHLSRVFVWVLMLALLTGCAPIGGYYPSYPETQPTYYLDKAAKAAQAGDVQQAMSFLATATRLRDGPEAVKDFLSKSPDLRSKIQEYYKQLSINSTDKQALTKAATFLPDYGKLGIVSDSEKLVEAINARAVEGNLSGEIGWLLDDNMSAFPALNTPNSQRIIFKRTLESLGDPSQSTTRLRRIGSIAGYLSSSGASNEEKQLAENYFRSMTLSKYELQTLGILYPDLVKEQLPSVTVIVQVAVSPSDRLLEEDIRTKLGSISSNYVLLKHGEVGDSSTVNVAIEKLRSEERQLPGQNQTITYSWTDVNPVFALLAMPQNASYMYEYSSGGVELEYGYVVRVSQKGRVYTDELIRGTLSARFVNCSNPRIVNVFGGTKRADFIANNDMQSRCSGSTISSPSIQNLRSRVFDEIIQKIISTEPLASRRD
jgi:hypothetical protein